MSDVVVLRLITGEHIVGEIVERSDSKVMLKKALTVNFTQDQNGQGRLSLSPVSPIIEFQEKGNEVSVYTSSITFEFSGDEEFINNYKQRVSSIILAN